MSAAPAGYLLDRSTLVGRERELAELARLLRPQPPSRIVNLTGPPGIGKSVLAAACLDRHLRLGPGAAAETIRAESAAAVGASLSAAVARHRAASSLLLLADPVAPAVEEALADAWAATVPYLSMPAVLLAVSRPALRLRSVRGPALHLRLEPLPSDAAAAVAGDAGPGGVRLAQLRAKGNPRALARLGAFATEPLPAAAPRLLAELAEEVGGELDLEVLAAAAAVRTANRPLLEWLLDRDLDETEYRTLSRLSIAARTDGGVRLDALAADLIAGELRHQDPDHWRRLRQRAYVRLMRDLEASRRPAVPAVLDVLYLKDDPVLRDGLFGVPEELVPRVRDGWAPGAAGALVRVAQDREGRELGACAVTLEAGPRGAATAVVRFLDRGPVSLEGEVALNREVFVRLPLVHGSVLLANADGGGRALARSLRFHPDGAAAGGWRLDRSRQEIGRWLVDLLGDRRGGTARPRSPQRVIGSIPVSQREAEVVEMAVRGLSARQIAERLFISPRTVETHLANAYVKLGVRSKRELAALAFD